MNPPSMEELFLNRERKRVLGYPVISMDELTAFFESNPCPPAHDSLFGKTMIVYGLPVLNELQANALETAVKTLSMFTTKEKFPERVMVGIGTAWKDEVE